MSLGWEGCIFASFTLAWRYSPTYLIICLAAWPAARRQEPWKDSGVRAEEGVLNT